MSVHEISEATKLAPDEVVDKAKHILDDLSKIDPETVLCMMGLVVHKDGSVRLASTDKNQHVKLHAFLMGDDEDIAKMFTTLVQIAKNGMVRANAPEDTSNEVKH